MMNGEKALTTQRPSWIQSQARRRVHGHLARLPHGGVVLREPDGATVTLGDADPFNAEIEIHDWDSYRMMMTGGALGAAEAYMAGAWDSPDLLAVIRYFAANVEAMLAWVKPSMMSGFIRPARQGCPTEAGSETPPERRKKRRGKCRSIRRLPKWGASPHRRP